MNNPYRAGADIVLEPGPIDQALSRFIDELTQQLVAVRERVDKIFEDDYREDIDKLTECMERACDAIKKMR